METDRHIHSISEVLYIGLCCGIGTHTQVKMRRDAKDIQEIVRHSLTVYNGLRSMDSGSSREGFRLAKSDLDIMVWFTNDIVICDLSQIPPYHHEQTLILMECHDTPPGFAKLQLLTPTNNLAITQSCVNVNDHLYISSYLYREVPQNIIQSFPGFQSATPHGPCTSGFFLGKLEYDFAYCFYCKHWPPPAYPWIEICQRRGWPSPQVLQDIISDGCHVVAIGSGRSTSHPQCDIEWRISFSLAECKLVASMNHAQFLCYGVLKIFLKEVLNVGLEDSLLCSYHVKTTLFWKIQENKVPVWCSKNILQCVWMCFKYLIQCVYKGEFPNFFIPENNMFMNKIYGAAQKQLFLHLMTLYNMGFSCLLRSQSLYQILSKVILNPHLRVSTVETNIISEAELDVELFTEICKNAALIVEASIIDTETYMKIDYLYKTIPPCYQNHIATLHVMRNVSLVRDAFILDMSRNDSINMHTTDNCRPLDMLISAAESGFVYI